MVSAFRDIWNWGYAPSLEYLMRNSIMALAENQDTTLLHINRLLVDEEFRERIVDRVQDPIVKDFWLQEFGSYPERLRSERCLPVQNKVGAFASQPVLRNILGQTKNALNFDKIIREQGILIVNLNKPRLGPEATSLLGALVLSSIKQAVMAQAVLPEAERCELNLYVDNCHNVVTLGFTSLLGETKDYKMNVVLGHQHLGQLREEIRDSILGNTGSLVCHRLGVPDAEFLEREFLPHYGWKDLVNLSPQQIIFKILEQGRVALPEGSSALPAPLPEKDEEYKLKLIEQSRRRFARPRARVEQMIQQQLSNGHTRRKT